MSQARSARDRVTGILLALLLQAGLIAAFLHTEQFQAPTRQLERELTFILPRLPPPPPADTAPPPRVTIPPLFSPPPPWFNQPAPILPAPNPATSALGNFGQSLLDCTPQNYANLPPSQQARCPRPAEGMATQQAPTMFDKPSRVKKADIWQEEYTHQHMTYGICPAGASTVDCQLQEIWAERDRQTHAEWEMEVRHAAAARKPDTLPPHMENLKPRSPESVSVHPQ